MAKKKARLTGTAAIKVIDDDSPEPPQEEPAEKKVVGKGKKACPKCGEVVGTRTAECPQCHEAFPAKTATTAARRPSTKPRPEKMKAEPSNLEKQIQALQTTAEFVTKVGGLEQAHKLLNIIETLQQ